MDVNDLLEQAKDWFQQLLGNEVKVAKPSIRKDTRDKSKKLSLGQELASQGILTGEGVSSELAEQFGMPVYNDISLMRLPKEYYEKVPYSFVKKHKLLPIQEENEKIVVAVSDPLDLDPLEELRMMLDQEIIAVYSPKDVILSSINECYDQESGAASQLIADLTGTDTTVNGDIEVYDLLEETPGQSPIIKLLNLIITEAIQQGASDIHFEPLRTLCVLDTVSMESCKQGTIQPNNTNLNS